MFSPYLWLRRLGRTDYLHTSLPVLYLTTMKEGPGRGAWL